ncbi:MAG TPA: DUF6206 family protein [Solirubrobacterales bacterium]|nr:DUF6206 family protein [Solirubrobacterales bacterium]
MSEKVVSPAAALSDAELSDLDALVERALAIGDESSLRVLGYGEISLVLGWPVDDPAFACKLLPPFAHRSRFDAYRDTLDDYLRALEAAGIDPVATELRPVERGDGTVAGYAVQRVLPPAGLAPAVLADADPDRGHPLVEAVVELAAATITPRVGLDAQLSNWWWEDGTLTYIDVTTPMLWSADGRPRLDVDLLVRPMPWAMRGPIKRLLAPRILDGYRDLRGVYLDQCGNLIKERLDAWLPRFLAAANERLQRPISADEVRRYYRSDARLWGALLAIRRLDRAWHLRVRRRPYPFLLPQRIER